MFLPHPRVKVSIVGSLRDREVACSASDRQGSNFESCVWRTVSSQSSHHPQEVLLAQFSLYVHKGGLKPDSFHLCTQNITDIQDNNDGQYTGYHNHTYTHKNNHYCTHKISWAYKIIMMVSTLATTTTPITHRNNHYCTYYYCTHRVSWTYKIIMMVSRLATTTTPIKQTKTTITR